MFGLTRIFGAGSSGRSRKTSDTLRHVRVMIDSETYALSRLTGDGFVLTGYTGDVIARQMLNFSFMLSMDGEEYDFVGVGKVLKIDGSTLTVHYRQPHPYNRKMLKRCITLERQAVDA